MPMPTMRRPEDTPGTEEFRRALAADQARTQRMKLPLSQWTDEDLAWAHRGAKSRQDRIYASSADLPEAKAQVNAQVSELWAELCRRAGPTQQTDKAGPLVLTDDQASRLGDYLALPVRAVVVALALTLAGPALAKDLDPKPKPPATKPTPAPKPVEEDLCSTCDQRNGRCPSCCGTSKGCDPGEGRR